MSKKMLWLLGSVIVVMLITLASLTGMVLARQHHYQINFPVTEKKEKAAKQEKPAPKPKEYKNAPAITAHAAIVVDLASGEVLYEKNADEWMYPASVTKIMTALLACESGRGDLKVFVSHNAAETEGTYMDEGDVLRLRDMTTEMMLISDNGAAVAIAEALAGSVPDFARMMNERAKDFGAKHTNFVNPSGLPDGNHITTARDLMLIAKGCWENEELRRIAGTIKRDIFWIQPADKKLLAENTNDLLEDYPGTLGLKTGWTNAAGGCLAAVCRRGDRTVLSITLHSTSGDDRFSDTAMLFDYVFAKSRHD